MASAGGGDEIGSAGTSVSGKGVMIDLGGALDPKSLSFPKLSEQTVADVIAAGGGNLTPKQIFGQLSAANVSHVIAAGGGNLQAALGQTVISTSALTNTSSG